jgi:hypothetical protein
LYLCLRRINYTVKIFYLTGKYTLRILLQVDSGMGLPMVNMLESTLEWTKGEVIVSSGRGSHTPCFSLDSASAICTRKRGGGLPLPLHHLFISQLIGGYFYKRRRNRVILFLGVSFMKDCIHETGTRAELIKL